MRKPLLYAGTAMLATVLLSGCGIAQQAPPQVFRNEAGGFEVTTPLELKEQQSEVDSPLGGKIAFHMFIGESRTRCCMVAYNDYPPVALNIEAALDGAREGALKSYKGGNLIKETKITYEGGPGRDLLIEGTFPGAGEGTLKLRFFLIGRRLYQVMFIAKKGTATDGEMDTFLNSFKLLKKPADAAKTP